MMSSSFADPLKFRILVVAGHENSGGPHIDKLLPSLSRMGYKVTFAGWDRRRQRPRKWESGVILVDFIFRGWGYANKSLALAYPLWILRVWVYLLRRRADCVYAIDFDTGLPAALASLLTGLPLIYDIRDNFSMRSSTPSLVRPFISWLDKWVIHRAQKIIVPDINRIPALDRLDRAKVVIISNCTIDLAPKHPDVFPQGHRFTVYSMGYLVKARGMDQLLDAARRLPDTRFLIAGVIFDKELEAAVRSVPNVDFRGFLPQEDALRLCFESDVLFTFYDPISEININAASNKWSDAMMASKPILINAEVKRSAWVQQENIGYTCAYGNVDELVKVLDHIREHPEEAQLKGANGRRLYEAGYNWAEMEQRLRRLLDELSDGHSVKRRGNVA
jgi:glycosyltransferase involved in cell wall biosynthesis